MSRRAYCDACGADLRPREVCLRHPGAGRIPYYRALRWALDYVRRGMPEDWTPAYWPGVSRADVALARQLVARWRQEEPLDPEPAPLDPLVLWVRRP